MPDVKAVKTVYVAGPMRGYAKFNFPAFDAERDRLVSLGYEVISPADIDRAEGYDATLDAGAAVVPTFEACMRRDIAALLNVQAISFLPGWEFSEGAQIEYVVGKALGLTLWYPNEEIPARMAEATA